MNFVEMIFGESKIKCPRCGVKLDRNRLSRTYVNRCKNGCGVWIDQQQLDQLVGTKTKRYEVTNDLPAQSLERSTAV